MDWMTSEEQFTHQQRQQGAAMTRGHGGVEVEAAADKQQQQRLSLKEQYRNAKLQNRQLHQEHQLHHLQRLALANQQQQPQQPQQQPHPHQHQPHQHHLGIVTENHKEAKLHWAERKAEQLRLRYGIIVNPYSIMIIVNPYCIMLSLTF